MSWRLRLSVETILRLTTAVLGSTVFSIAGLCAAHACLDDQALLAAREAIGSSSFSTFRIPRFLAEKFRPRSSTQADEAAKQLASDRVLPLRRTDRARPARGAAVFGQADSMV